MSRPKRYRTAITLIEVLVTISVIGILIGLLMPAVMAARGAARKAQCGNNLKQLAAAVQQHHQRKGVMPAYWGLETGNASDLFAGWLAHLLPDLGQQVLFDSIGDKVAPVATLASGTVYRYALTPTDEMLPATEQTNPYVPGQWVTRRVGTAKVGSGKSITEIPIYRTSLEGRVGRPAYPARRKWAWTVVEAIPTTLSSGTKTFANTFGLAQQPAKLNFLQDVADPSRIGPADTVVVENSTWTKNPDGSLPAWSLTNYVANAHAFTKMGERVALPPGGPTFASLDSTRQNYTGLFTPAMAWPSNAPTGSWVWNSNGQFNNKLAMVRGFQPRRFSHIGDGLSNTIMFGEAMRQCDGSYRVAFLPVGYESWEHGFGIEPSYVDAADPTKWYPGSAADRTFGNTLMFQTQPTELECNPMRTQAMHGAYLMVAMCDGSVRPISSTVSRKEAVGANTTGREAFGTRFYSIYSRAVATDDESSTSVPLYDRPDGIWDMLLVPNDPDTNTLSNTGEIGKDK